MQIWSFKWKLKRCDCFIQLHLVFLAFILLPFISGSRLPLRSQRINRESSALNSYDYLPQPVPFDEAGNSADGYMQNPPEPPAVQTYPSEKGGKLNRRYKPNRRLRIGSVTNEDQLAQNSVKKVPVRRKKIQVVKGHEFDEKQSHNPEESEDLQNKVHELESEIRHLEHKGAPDPVIKANFTYSLKWKQYKNLTDVDTMELKYEIAGLQESKTLRILLYIVVPSIASILFLYTAVTLYWTKCWFYKVVPPHRYSKFERYELDLDDDAIDMASPLSPFGIKEAPDARELVPEIPRQPILDDEEARDEDDRNFPRRQDTSDDERTYDSRKSRRKRHRNQFATADDGFSLAEYDINGRPRTRSKSPKNIFSGRSWSRNKHKLGWPKNRTPKSTPRRRD